jgi:carboxynorspermidine decarboxylase
MPDEFERTLSHIVEKFSPWFSQLKWINFGGGHLMTHKDYDREKLISILQDFHRSYPKLKVILEPGSAFAWQTGVLSSKVVDIVENKGIRTAILNVSFTCHMPDCLEMPYQPDIIGAKKGEDGPFIYRMGGNSCLSGDFIGSWSFDHELQRGERIIFEDMIHYTTVKTNMFNGIHHPSLGMWTKDDKAVIFKDFTYEDYRGRMS